jgi:glycosyltransferase involved in cell wall biosynthesis
METYSARLVQSLRAITEVDVIALPGRRDGAPPMAMSLFRFGLTTAIRLLLTKPREVTHVGDMASWPFALMARLRSNRTRIALSAHGTDVSFPLRGGLAAHLYGFYLRAGARLLPSAVVIANSTTTAEAARSFGFEHVAAVPLATDIRGEPPSQPHGQNLLFVGRLTARKGCAWFIRNVLPLLPASITLRVVGTIWDDDERAALDDARVIFVGPCHGDALIREYSSALCVVVPNINVPTREFEGFGLTAVEAAASGGLALVSHHSGLREAVIDGVTGFHLPPGDAVAWAQKIQDIRNWPDSRRRAFIANAIATARQRYSWERVARETLFAYAQELRSLPVAPSISARDTSTTR